MITSLFGASFDRRVGSKFVSQGKYLPTSIRAKLLYAKPVPWSGDWEAPSGDWEAASGDTDYSAHKLPGKTDPSYAAIYAAVNDGSGFWYDGSGDPVARLLPDILAEIRTNTWNIWCNNRGRLMVFSKALLYSEAAIVERYILGSRPAVNAPPTTSDVVLHYDADKAELAELTGGASPLNHSVLSPQYERQSDGSYVDVGARPAVDTFADGFVGLRSCGQVQNLLLNSKFNGAVGGSPGIPPDSWSFSGNISAPYNWTWLDDGGVYKLKVTISSSRMYWYATFPVLSTDTHDFSLTCKCDGVLSISHIAAATKTGATITYFLDGVSVSNSTVPSPGVHLISLTISNGTGTSLGVIVGAGVSSSSTGSVEIYNPQLTKTSYPQPYVPTSGTSVTQPASNATATNGSWFANPLDSDLWKALTGSPLTLATRVRMGIGSADLTAIGSYGVLNPDAISSRFLYIYRDATLGVRWPRSFDGVTPAQPPTNPSFLRGTIFNVFIQVNTAVTQFRVGYMIEGTHATIQWGAWAAFDGSFDPSTLYRLILGGNNPYPMWLNKLTVWKRQVSDDELAVAWL